MTVIAYDALALQDVKAETIESMLDKAAKNLASPGSLARPAGPRERPHASPAEDRGDHPIVSRMPGILLQATADSTYHLNVLLLLGIAVFGGTIGARIFRRLRIPQIIGSILIGLLIGESGLRLVSEGVVQAVEPLNYFALGIIGFLIGGELKLEILLPRAWRPSSSSPAQRSS